MCNSKKPSEQDYLTPEEIEILIMYRNLSDEEKQEILSLVRSLKENNK